MAESLDLNDIRIHALTTVGSAKEYLGDTTGRDDLEEAIEWGSPPTLGWRGRLNNLTVVLDTTDCAVVETSSAKDVRRRSVSATPPSRGSARELHLPALHPGRVG
jgi:hypothetical protein